MANHPSWDSHGPLIGVNTQPSESRLVAHRALNMDFRNGNEPRHGNFHMDTTFENDADKEIFENGNVQKVAAYGAYGNRPASLIYLIAGYVFSAAISGKSLMVKRLWSGLRPDVMLGWMCQGFEWFVIQNGSDKPIIWNGGVAAVQSDSNNAEMPIGGPMAFIHHSIAVCSTDGKDKIAISDRWTQMHSDNVWKFTDTPTWDNAGVFGLHANFGKIVALTVIPQIKQTPNGQGDLLICGTNGGQTLNLQMARADFLDGQIQDTALIGSGFASYLGVMPVNSSIYYVSQNGLEEVLRRRAEFQRSDAEAIESSDIELYWNQANPNLRSFTALGHHDNKIFMGALPETSPSTKWGMHRYNKAWLTLDVSERYRSGQRIPRAWYGLQCGLRPIEWVNDVLVNRVHRTYVISHDHDGINRTYEVTKHLANDVVNGQAVPIKSFFVSPTLGNRKRDTLLVKQPIAARVDFQDVQGNISVGMEWRAEHSMCWKDWNAKPVTASPSEDLNKLQLPATYGGSAVFGDPQVGACDVPPPTEFRVKVSMTGHANVRNVFVKIKESSSPEDGLRDIFAAGCAGTIKPSTCQDDFEIYHNPPII